MGSAPPPIVTIGIVSVAFLAALIPGSPPATMISTVRRTKSAARAKAKGVKAKGSHKRRASEESEEKAAKSEGEERRGHEERRERRGQKGVRVTH